MRPAPTVRRKVVHSVRRVWARVSDGTQGAGDVLPRPIAWAGGRFVYLPLPGAPCVRASYAARVEVTR